MECIECSWTQLQISITITIISSIFGGVLGVYLVKHPFKAKIEKIFQKNTDFVDNILFSNISHIDSYKNTIFKNLETNSKFDPNKGTVYTYPKQIYDEIFRYRELILNRIEKIQSFKHLPGDITIDNLLKIQRYTATAYQFINKINNVDDGIFYNPRELERHKFYAKEIIIAFGKPANRFYHQWESEFNKIGGMHSVKYLPHEPGDTVGIDVNLDDELLLWDPQFSTLRKDVQELKQKINELS